MIYGLLGFAVEGQLSGKFLPALDEVGIAGEICDDALNGLCLGINEAGDRISQINFGSLFGGFGYLLHRRFRNVEIVALLLDAVVKKLARHDSNIENRIFFKIEGEIEPFSLSATVTVTNPRAGAFFSVTSLPRCSLSGPEGLSQMSASPVWLRQTDWLGRAERTPMLWHAPPPADEQVCFDSVVPPTVSALLVWVPNP